MTSPVRCCGVCPPSPEIYSCHLDLPVRVVWICFVIGVVHLDYELRCLRPVYVCILRRRYVVYADVILFNLVTVFIRFALPVRVGRIEEIFPRGDVRTVVIVREVELGPVNTICAVVFPHHGVVFPRS